MDLSSERWERAAHSEREAIARQLSRQLPAGFVFHSIRLHRMGEQQRHVAIFQQARASFALIPGGSVALGYDAERAWTPNPDELESWQHSAEEYGSASTIQEYLAEVTSRPRQVELGPFLIETAPREQGWKPVGIEDPEVQAILREHRSEQQVEWIHGDVITRVRRGSQDALVAERAVATTHAELAGEQRASGFRLPTSDEWEFACGGGAPTLFRWGDHVPCDRYPTDISPTEAAWRREWVLSGGTLQRPPGGFTADWDLHRQPNVFGLLIALAPYKSELVAEIGTTRGGDGGSSICGGAGFFLGWLPLASAYFDEYTCKHSPGEPISPGHTMARRVLDLR